MYDTDCTMKDNNTVEGVSPKAQHTPGPWVAEQSQTRPDFWAVSHIDNSGLRISDVTYVTLGERREANARLIAAAPEMLEALAQLIFAVTEDSPVPLPDDAPALVWARAAIAKATT